MHASVDLLHRGKVRDDYALVLMLGPQIVRDDQTVLHGSLESLLLPVAPRCEPGCGTVSKTGVTDEPRAHVFRGTRDGGGLRFLVFLFERPMPAQRLEDLRAECCSRVAHLNDKMLSGSYIVARFGFGSFGRPPCDGCL